MAGNGNSGRSPTFAINDKKLDEYIAEYKSNCMDGIICRPSWLHFCATIDYTAEEVRDVMECADKPESAYRKRAIALKKMGTWIHGQVTSGSYGWSDAPSPIIKAELETDWGFGSFVGNKTKDTGPQEVRVVFGAGDPRSKRAAE